MRTRMVLTFLVSFFLSTTTFAQKADTLVKKLDSLSKVDTAGIAKNNIKPGAYNETTKITVPGYFILLGTDLVQEVTGPFHSGGRTWTKVAAFAVIEGGLFFADEPVQRFASNLTAKNKGIQGISKYVTNFGGLYEAYTLGALGLYSVVFKNEKVKTTTLLATQAYITGGAMEAVIKFISGRQRPNYYDANHLEPEPTFHGPFQSLGRDKSGAKLNSSFPSGHTTVAFAAATVFAMEYKDKPLIPIISYSAATLIGLSRLTENKHWATDVFAGAALGYVTGKQVVNNYHRYARLKAQEKITPTPKRRKGTMSLNMGYDFGKPAAGFVYTFKLYAAYL